MTPHLHSQAPSGSERQENCIAGPSRIEIIGLARGYKAPCHYGQGFTRKDKGCKFDYGRGEDKAANAICEQRKRRKRTCGLYVTNALLCVCSFVQHATIRSMLM
jgi:hypothetical protein